MAPRIGMCMRQIRNRRYWDREILAASAGSGFLMAEIKTLNLDPIEKPGLPRAFINDIQYYFINSILDVWLLFGVTSL